MNLATLLRKSIFLRKNIFGIRIDIRLGAVRQPILHGRPGNETNTLLCGAILKNISGVSMGVVNSIRYGSRRGAKCTCREIVIQPDSAHVGSKLALPDSIMQMKMLLLYIYSC